MPKQIEITFDGTAAGGSSGVQQAVAISTVKGFSIYSVEVTKEDNSTCKLNMTSGLKKRSIFGTNPVFSLVGDLTGLMGSPSPGGDVQSWKSLSGGTSSGRISADPDSASARPVVDYDMGDHGTVTGLAGVQFSDDDNLELPDAMHFGSDEFTIFVVTKGTFDPDGDDDLYVLGSTNTGSTSATGVWGVQGGRRIVCDLDGDEEKENDHAWASGQIRMLSRYTNGRVTEWLDGTELDTWNSFGGDFDFDWINKTATRSGVKGSGELGIVELIAYSDGFDTMGSDEREEIEGYLAHKYGLEGNLPSGHPYKGTDPRGSDYDEVLQSPDKVVTTSFTDWDIDLKRLDPKVPLQFIYTDIDEPGTVTIKVTYVPN